MKDAERTELLEVVGTAIAEKAEALMAPVTERLDEFETRLDAVAEKAEAGKPAKPAKPDGEAEAEAAAAAKAEEDERIQKLEDDLAAAKTEHDEFVSSVTEKIGELTTAPKSVTDDDPDPKATAKDSGRDAFGRKTKKGRASA